MRIHSNEFEAIYDKLLPLWDEVKNEFFKSGEEYPEVNMSIVKMNTDMMITLLKRLQRIKSTEK